MTLPNPKLQNQWLMMNGWQPQRRGPVMFAMLLILAGLGYYFYQQKDVSGVYVDQTPDVVHVLQLVESRDGKLNAEYASVAIDATGRLQQTSASLAGKIDGANIDLSVKGALAQPMQLKIVGTRGYKNLTLSISILGEAVETGTYIPSDLATFQFAADALKRRAANIPAEKKSLENEQQFVGRVKAFTQQLKTSSANIDSAIKKFSPTGQDYHRITEKVAVNGQKAQNLPGDSYAVMRKEVIVDMIQDASDTTRIHDQIKAFQADFDTKLQPMAKELFSDGEACGHYASDDAAAACSGLKYAGGIFGQRRDAMMAALANLEVTYQSELQSQQGYIARAEELR